MSSSSPTKTFYTLVLTQAFSSVGSQISGLAIGIWIYAKTGAATPLALVAFFGTVPRILASTLAGVLADRWDRRWVMALADAGQASGTVVLLVSFASGAFELWHLYAVVVVQSVFAAFQGPAMEASTTLLIADDQRDRANAINQMASPLAGLLAPAIAGLVYAVVGVVGAIAIDLATFVVAVVVVLAIRLPRPRATEEGRAAAGTVWREALGGLRVLWGKRGLFYLMLHISLVNFLLGGALVLSLPYLLARIGDEATVGVLLSVMNLGALVGGVVMGVWGGTRPRIHTVLPGIALVSFFLALTGTAETSWSLGAGFFAIMLPLPFINAAFMSILQIKIPSDLQGRAFAVVEQMALMSMPAAFLVAGPLADRVFEPAVSTSGWQVLAPLFGDGPGAGIGLLFTIAGLACLILTLAVYASPGARRLEASLPDYAVPAEAAAEEDGAAHDPEETS